MRHREHLSWAPLSIATVAIVTGQGEKEGSCSSCELPYCTHKLVVGLICLGLSDSLLYNDAIVRQEPFSSV